MKQIYKLLILILIFQSSLVFSQNESVVRFFKTGKENGQKLFQQYIGSASDALGFTLNNGWYQGGDIKKTGRFTIKLVGNLAFSTNEEEFNIENLGLDNVVLTLDNQVSESPTVMKSGGNEGQTIAYVVEEDTLSKFNMPSGLGFMPSVFLQANVGLPYRTEAMVRFLPNLGTNSLSSDAGGILWGLGFKHDIQQWIPRVNLWSVRLALGFGFTRFQGKLDARSIPDTDPSTGTFYPQATGETPDYTGQSIDTRINAWNLALLLSKKIYAVTIYTGLRYDRSSTSLEVLGTYPLTERNSTGELQTVNISNPFSNQQSFSQISLNAGVRVKLGPAQIFLDGNFGKSFLNLNAGLGFGWGKN